MDTLLDMQGLERRWDMAFPAHPFRILEMALQIEEALLDKRDKNYFLHKKAIILLVLLCSELALGPANGLLGQLADFLPQRPFWRAFIAITREAGRDRSVARLASSKLIDDPLLIYHYAQNDTDVQVGYVRLCAVYKTDC